MIIDLDKVKDAVFDAKVIVAAVLKEGQGIPKPIAYSGRVMYGQKCLGFPVRSTHQKLTLLLKIKDALREFYVSTIELVNRTGPFNFDTHVDYSFTSVKEAALGAETVVYFPNLLWDEACEKLIENND